MSKPKRFKRILTQDPDDKYFVTKADKVHKVKKYSKKKCVIQGCKRNAKGKYDKCKKHLTDSSKALIDHSELIPAEEASSYLLKTYHKDRALQYLLLSSQGMSEVEIAAEFKVGVACLHKWAETFVEFAEAYEAGNALHETWWLQRGKENLDNSRYNTGLYKYLTMNKLGYSDKVESKNLHVHAGVLKVPETKGVEEWEKEAEKLRKK